MDIKEYKDLLSQELKGLKEDMEGKTTKEVNEAIAAVETKMTDIVAEKFKGAEDKLEEQKAFTAELEKTVNQLGAKLQEKNFGKKSEVKNLNTEIARLIEEKVKPVGSVLELKKGEKFAMDTKTVGDMILGNHLTGDQPRDYSNIVQMVPGQLLNVSDIIGSIMISGGTYTFPRETTSEGSISTQTEGNAKSQIDYDLSLIDVNTDFLAGFAVYSRKMANNLSFLEGFLPQALRRDYMIAENSLFNTALAAGVTASAQAITGQNKVEMLLAELATLEGTNYSANGIVVRPADWYDIMITEKSTGAGYGLPGHVSMINGILYLNGVPVFKANWLAANKYYVGDWSFIKKVVTEGLSLSFSTEDSDNFRKNLVTARIEAQIGIAIHRTQPVVYGDFTAT
ncbi:MAG TPA: phage major capsid protein [Desulfosporosinus sp.]|nr:phage major capsid protein [Desulfosporosinus sp.]